MEKWGRKGKKTRNRETGGKGKEKRVRGNSGMREVGEMDGGRKKGKWNVKGKVKIHIRTRRRCKWTRGKRHCPYRGKESGNLLPSESLIPAANLPPVSLMLVVHLDLRISPRIFKKFEWPNWDYQGLGGRWSTKNLKKKISLRCLFKWTTASPTSAFQDYKFFTSI